MLFYGFELFASIAHTVQRHSLLPFVYVSRCSIASPTETITSLTKDLVFTLGFLLPYQREVILWFTRKFVQNFC